jgi:hypothetical protein
VGALSANANDNGGEVSAVARLQAHATVAAPPRPTSPAHCRRGSTDRLEGIPQQRWIAFCNTELKPLSSISLESCKLAKNSDQIQPPSRMNIVAMSPRPFRAAAITVRHWPQAIRHRHEYTKLRLEA